ncbi:MULTISPECIES: nucleoside-diphosphate sugar epimerase [unclassified Paenibacillus]|uniref:nucleoside-diphosphate sugar epimerase n=1 Tax=unclassified Paenibacillus TaxID=185978 RepID=UPI001AE5D2D7|nr:MULTISPECIES: nucleoside-diphosphate sugar epimerase [unclassified Paenibacillus]MBP1156657.1 hypothetical protein [Paenibacillus sp. PvP091]MBP1172605.1 hypothetical protein [Paenibacillus sp. PvR098]MBP2438985.1 hypothetical protein [Paenibacillus sp. PvP052]
MHQKVTNIIEYMASSHWEMTKILESKRHVAVRMAHLVHEIPHENPTFRDIEDLMEKSLSVTKNIATYLNSLADLSDAIADNLILIMKEVEIPEGEE